MKSVSESPALWAGFFILDENGDGFRQARTNINARSKTGNKLLRVLCGFLRFGTKVDSLQLNLIAI